MKYYDFSKLNRHAMAVLAYMNDSCKGMKEGEEKEISLACECNEEKASNGDSVLVNGDVFSISDIICLNGTYSKWRKDNGLNPVLFDLSLNLSTTIGEVAETKYYTMKVSVCKVNTLGYSLFDDMEEDKDLPKTLKKRDGKAEKAKTAENNAKKEADAKTVEEAKQIVENAKQTAEVTAEEEVKNEEKAMQRKADALNADTVATIFETTIRRIGLIVGVKWEDMDKKQKNAIKDALKDHVKMLENGSVM